MDDTAHVGSGGVDGRVQAEARGVHWEAAAALLHHLSQDVHLDLGRGGRETSGHQQAEAPHSPPRRWARHTPTHLCPLSTIPRAMDVLYVGGKRPQSCLQGEHTGYWETKAIIIQH